MTGIEQSQREYVLYMIRLAPDSPACRLAIRELSEKNPEQLLNVALINELGNIVPAAMLVAGVFFGGYLVPPPCYAPSFQHAFFLEVVAGICCAMIEFTLVFKNNGDERGYTMKKRFSLLLFILILTFYLPTSAESVFPGDSWIQVDSPESVGWSTGKLKLVGDYASSTGTLGLMIIQGGKVVYTYGNITEQSSLHSVRKSLLSGLIGVFVESGKIDPQSTLESLGIDDSPPTLTQQEKQARIIDLLKARSGVYHAAAAETQKMKELRPPRGSHAPGSYWYYNNWDFNVLGVIFEKNTKQSIGKAFFDTIAQPIGMQQFSPNSVYYQKSPDSIHPAYRFKMSTQDIARFGLLYLNHGVWKGKQLIPEKWIIDSTTSYSNASPGVGYGYMWWLPTNVIYGQTIPGAAWRAEGVGGQYIIVIPSMDLVVAHLSKYDSTGIDSYPTFRNLFRLILEARVK